MVADALSVLACGPGHGIDMGNSGIYRKRRSSRNPDRRHTSRPVERDPSKADDSIPGSDPVSGKAIWCLPVDGWWEKSGIWQENIWFPECLRHYFPLFLFLRHLEDPIMYRHGGGWRKSHGGLQHGWEGSCCCWLQFKTVPLWRWCGAINIWKQQGLTGNGV